MEDQGLEYMVSNYYTSADFEVDSSSDNDHPTLLVHDDDDDDDDSLDSSFEQHHFDQSKPKTDTSAMEARNGKDIQGIPWERLNFTRDNYRETRLAQYRNYESLSLPRGELEKEFNKVEKGHSFFDFQFNTRLVKSTIVHFQFCSCCCTISALIVSLIRYPVFPLEVMEYESTKFNLKT